MAKDASGYERLVKTSGRSLSDAARFTLRGPKGGGGGSFSDRWKPPTGEPEQIVLFANDYKFKALTPDGEFITIERPYAFVYEHWYQTTRRAVTCSAGLKFVSTEDGDAIVPGDEPCVACYMGGEGNAAVSRRKVHVFNAVRFGQFHHVDTEGKPGADGKTRTYKNWIQCIGKKCPHCKAGLPKEFGQTVYWPVGQRFMDQLMEFESKVLARRCRCGGKLKPAAFLCSECGDIVRDLKEDPATKEELGDLRKDSYVCKCGNTDKLKELTSCSSCRKPDPLTMWDVVLTVSRTGTQKTDSNLLVSEYEVIEPAIMEQLAPKMKPFDFYGRIYKRLAPADQAKRLEVKNPFGGSAKASVPYDDDDDETTTDGDDE